MSRRWFITGGTPGGFGVAFAEAALETRDRVVLTSRRPQELATWADQYGDRVLVVPLELTDAAQVQGAVRAAEDHFGGIDVLVNNAANALAQPLGEMTPEAWAKSYDSNLRGPVFLVQKALPHLKASPAAAVLNMSSVGAFQFAPFVSMYAAGKAALLSFTRSMAAAYAADGIRVNAIAPGPVDTDMVRNNPQEAIDVMASNTLLKRLASPDEMVGTALLLCSGAGSYITGQVVIVDGGGTPR